MSNIFFVRALEVLPMNRNEVCDLIGILKFFTGSRQETLNPHKELSNGYRSKSRPISNRSSS